MTNSTTDKRNSIFKVTGYWILFLALLIPVTSQSGATFSAHVHNFTFGIFGTAIALFITWIFIKSENKSFASYNLIWKKETLTKFFQGLAIGIASFVLITVILVLFGGLKIEKNPNVISSWIWFWYLAILPAVLMEEIVFRSYSLLKLKKAFGLRLTQLIVSIAFALYHIPLGWNISTAFLGPGIWALVFGISAIRSNGIALPAGIHVGLNLVLSILGMSRGAESFFVTSQNESTSNNIVNLTTRILVLLAGIILTEFFIRKSKRENESNELGFIDR
jgi:uncharacterized protein